MLPTQTWPGQEGGGRGGNPSARTHNRGCCDGDHGFSPFRFNLAIRTSLSLVRENSTLVLFFFCLWDCVRLRFRFRLPTLFRLGGGSARTKPPTQTHVKRAKNANFPCPYRASFAFHGPTQGNGPAELQVASERSLALSLSRLLRFARTILSRGHVRPLVVAELWKSRGRSDHRAVISCIVSSFRFKNGSCEYAFCFISLFKTIFIL